LFYPEEPQVGKRKDEAEWTRLAEDWKPSLMLMAWAKMKRADLSASQIEDEIENFLEYWINKPGKAGEKKDWDRAFQTWIRKATIRYKPKNYHNYTSNNDGVVL
jgi:hypothetical protein